MGRVYFATNREVDEKQVKQNDTDDLFKGHKFNSDPNQLRFVRVDYTVNRDKKKYELNHYLYADNESLGSNSVFAEIQNDMKTNKRDCAIFVHGYNNDWKDSLYAAIHLAENYDINVLCFSWPSSIAILYKDCKDRAIQSVPAFNRLVEKFTRYMGGTDIKCGQKVSLICHSMGNYILKKFVTSSHFDNEFIPFHNVNLVAADTNVKDHADWVNKIHCLGRVNIIQNEEDIALDFSDTKRGKAQGPRLGNTPKNLNSKADYYNVTDGKDVNKSHSYFNNNKILRNNRGLYNLCNMAFHGERISGMKYHTGLNYYTLPDEYNDTGRKWISSLSIPNF
jgi:esterase/lipase superfamily enzyme